jgi:hypothetical protein
VGLVVAYPSGIYLCELNIDARLRLRDLVTGAVRVVRVESLRLDVGARRALVLSHRPGRFPDMTVQALRELHSRLSFEGMSNDDRTDQGLFGVAFGTPTALP